MALIAVALIHKLILHVFIFPLTLGSGHLENPHKKTTGTCINYTHTH